MSLLGNIGFNSSAVITRQQQTIFPFAAASFPAGTVMATDVYPVDSKCPFFHIFAAIHLQPDCVWQLAWSFSNGGTPISTGVAYFGALVRISNNAVPRMMPNTIPGGGFGFFTNGTGAIAQILPTDLSDGFMTRWSGLADQVTMTLTALLDNTTSDASNGIMGIIQQPW